MIQKPFDRIEKVDIDSLVANATEEGRNIEYKQALPGNADKQKKEFLADVSSFANASGGDLLYGVEEQRDGEGKPTGIPTSVPGVPIPNADAEIRRLENIIRDGIRPRIAGVHLRTVDGFANGPVLLIRIQRSYALPHMVTFQEHSRFYARNSKGKYPLDVGKSGPRSRSRRASRRESAGSETTGSPASSPTKPRSPFPPSRRSCSISCPSRHLTSSLTTICPVSNTGGMPCVRLPGVVSGSGTTSTES